MRSTLLHFRSPDQRTGEYQIVKVDNKGTTYEIIPESHNVKSTFPKGKRFFEGRYFCNYTGQCNDLGPGRYTATIPSRPCSAIMKKSSYA